MKQSSDNWKLLSRVATIGLIALAVWYFSNNKESFEQVLIISPIVILSLAIFKSVRVFINGLFTKFTLEAFGKHMSVTEANKLSLHSSAGNFFGPILGGAGIRAVYLKRKHGFEYSKFLSTLYGYYLISFITISLLAITALYLPGLVSADNSERLTSLWFFGGVLGANLLLITLPSDLLMRFSKYLKLPQRLQNIVRLITEGWTTIRSNKRLLWRLSLLCLAGFLIAILEVWLLYGQFAAGFTIGNILIYTALGAVTIIISFTPGAIGIKEVVFLATGSLIALNTEQILQIAAIDRSVSFITIGLLYAASQFVLRENKENKY